MKSDHKCECCNNKAKWQSHDPPPDEKAYLCGVHKKQLERRCGTLRFAQTWWTRRLVRQAFGFLKP